MPKYTKMPTKIKNGTEVRRTILADMRKAEEDRKKAAADEAYLRQCAEDEELVNELAGVIYANCESIDRPCTCPEGTYTCMCNMGHNRYAIVKIDEFCKGLLAVMKKVRTGS